MYHGLCTEAKKLQGEHRGNVRPSDNGIVMCLKICRFWVWLLFYAGVVAPCKLL